jgi:Zn-dependent protease with chaperone function
LSVPFAYALALAVALIARELFPLLPGAGSVGWTAACAPLLAMPAWLSARALVRLRRRGRPDFGVRLLARAAPASLAAGYAIVLGPCGYLDLIDRWSGDSHAAAAALLVLPLFAAEFARAVVEARLAPDAGIAAQLRARLAFLGVFTMPWLLLGVGGDLLAGHRGLYAFVAGTSPGLTIGAILFVMAMAFALPLAFRFVFGFRADLPDAIAGDVRRTAAALGFPGRAVLWLDSGMRNVNALLVGPLPWPRYLVLTDGLLAALDPNALRGVVAHEVGHAQAGHPALLLALFVVTPLLVANVAQPFEDDSSVTWTVVGLVVAVVVAWRVLRRVAHRFEHEADVLSAIALGGADPCISALQRVGQVVQQEPERASMLHPSESARVSVLRRFAEQPEFRAKFALRGVHLRRAIGITVLAAALAAGWTWYRTWPYERASLLFQTGDLAGARRQADLVGTDVPGRRWEWWHAFRQDLEAASTIAGDGGEWERLRPQFAQQGWQRGVEVLRRDGAASARPWFALAAEDAERSPVRRCMVLYCEAARDGDTARMAAIAAHIDALGRPAELRDLLVQ